MKKQKFLVCSALPYANGPLHIGHLAGCYVPGDVYARARKMQGHEVLSICGSDEYGAAITIRAMQEKISPAEVVDKYHAVIKNDLESFSISHDVFSRTTRPYHAERAQEFFTNLLNAGLIERKDEQRLFCFSCAQFLPDRYVVGDCPACGKPGARGDQCEKCGAWFEPEKLLKPICQICKKNEASLKNTSHWYFRLDKLEPKLRAWIDSKKDWRPNVLGYANQPLKEGLAARSITRDLSWGVPVPLPEADGKVLYVWIDAPIGYISATEEWSINSGNPDAWRRWWEDKETRLIHFIGKDNIIFHTVVWPALLMGDGRYVLPDLVAGNEFLNLQGQKISTSRNFAVWAAEAAAFCDRDLFRFYLTAISPEGADADFNWKDFQNQVNGGLADVIGNYANRILSFVQKNYESILVPAGYEKIAGNVLDPIEECQRTYYKQLDGGFTKGMLDAVMGLGRRLNQLMQELAPWKVRKENPVKAQEILCDLAHGIKALALFLAPICPGVAQKIWVQLGMDGDVTLQSFEDVRKLMPQGQRIASVIGPIINKIEDDAIDAQIAKLSGVVPQ